MPSCPWRERVLAVAAFLALLACPRDARAASGTEGASFLDIPAGARPAALGGAYSALAADAYAPVWNPAGLGFLPATQISGMHLEYAQSIAYEFASAVHPFGEGNGIGLSAQYLHPQNTTSRDASGNEVGSFSSYYGAYSLAYGRAVSRSLSLGGAFKVVSARIGDVSASAIGGDVGGLYRLGERLSVAVVAANVGTKLKFIQDGDRLPENYRAGLLWTPVAQWSLSAEAAYDRTDRGAGRFGAEWRPLSAFAVRAGYRTDAVQRLSGVTGVTLGAGFELYRQRFDYAWVPMGQLGQTHYFSIVITFGKAGGS